jgi:hypothetical protein
LSIKASSEDFVDAVASEMAVGVEKAVECWMSLIEEALTDPYLTSLGRLNAVRAILEEYKQVTGKAHLKNRNIC